MTEEMLKIYTMEPSEATQPYWDAANEGRLLLKTCNACGAAHHYPRTSCPHCLSDDTVWTDASGEGVIYTVSVFRRAPVPYAIGYVTLAEGPTMMTGFIDCDLDALTVDQAVRVCFRESEKGQQVPFFTPAG